MNDNLGFWWFVNSGFFTRLMLWRMVSHPTTNENPRYVIVGIFTDPHLPPVWSLWCRRPLWRRWPSWWQRLRWRERRLALMRWIYAMHHMRLVGRLPWFTPWLTATRPTIPCCMMVRLVRRPPRPAWTAGVALHAHDVMVLAT